MVLSLSRLSRDGSYRADLESFDSVGCPIIRRIQLLKLLRDQTVIELGDKIMELMDTVDFASRSHSVIQTNHSLCQ